MAVVMLSPLIWATCSMTDRSSVMTKRHGWLFSWEGARPATSISSRWCSSVTGSGRNGPFVVLRRRTTSRKSMLLLLDGSSEAAGEERGGRQRDQRVPGQPGAGERDHDERRGRRQQPPPGAAAAPHQAAHRGAREHA